MKSKLHLLSILIFCLLSLNSISVYSQFSPWYRVWNSNDRNSDGKIVVQTSDSGYAILVQESLYAIGQVCYKLVKYDYTGNFLFANIIADTIDTNRNLFEFCQTSDSGFIFAGTSTGAILIRTDKTGNLKWQKKYTGLSSQTRFYNVSQTNDKGYIACGYYIDYSPPSQKAIVIKTDSLGNLQWEKQFMDSLINSYSDIVQDSLSNYFVSGYVYNNTSRLFGIIKKLDSSGDQIWSKIYSSNVIGLHILYTGGNNLFTAGTYKPSYPYPTLAKLDTSGNVKWVYNNYTFPEFQYACMDKFNDIVITGNYAPGGYFPTIGLIKIDSAGNIIKSKLVQYSGFDGIHSTCIKPTSDLGYIICGDVSTRDSLYNIHSKVLLLKTDTAFNSPIITHLVNKTKIVDEFSIYQNYPNPFNTSTILKICMPDNEILDIKIFDLLGRLVFSNKQYFKIGMNEIKLDFSNTNFTTGVYFLKIKNKTVSKSLKILYLK